MGVKVDHPNGYSGMPGRRKSYIAVDIKDDELRGN